MNDTLDDPVAALLNKRRAERLRARLDLIRQTSRATPETRDAVNKYVAQDAIKSRLRDREDEHLLRDAAALAVSHHQGQKASKRNADARASTRVLWMRAKAEGDSKGGFARAQAAALARDGVTVTPDRISNYWLKGL